MRAISKTAAIAALVAMLTLSSGCGAVTIASDDGRDGADRLHVPSVLVGENCGDAAGITFDTATDGDDRTPLPGHISGTTCLELGGSFWIFRVLGGGELEKIGDGPVPLTFDGKFDIDAAQIDGTIEYWVAGVQATADILDLPDRFNTGQLAATGATRASGG